MPSTEHVFAIVTNNDAIPLAEGRGEVSYTVTNRSGHPLRARARAVPLGSTEEVWLKITGESEREFAAAGTQQFLVQVTCPLNTPAGKYPFRLDVASSQKPEEEFAEGQTVTVTVPPPPNGHHKRWWLIPATALALVVIVFTAWMLWPKATMPAVVGLSLKEATEQIRKMQPLEPQVTRKFTGREAADIVLAQDPKPGEPLSSDTTVKLDVEPGETVVPRVVEEPIEEARRKLAEAHLKVTETQEPRPNVSPGHVADQTPGAGEKVAPNTTVKLVVAVLLPEPQKVEVPEVPNVVRDLSEFANRGKAIAKSDRLVAAFRDLQRTGASQLGFDIGMGVTERDTLWGPGKQRILDLLRFDEQRGFKDAATFSLVRNNNAVLAAKGADIADADPDVAGARTRETSGLYWLGFDIATGIFGNPARGALGNTQRGPGSEKIRSTLSEVEHVLLTSDEGQRGFDASVAFHLGRNHK